MHLSSVCYLQHTVDGNTVEIDMGRGAGGGVYRLPSGRFLKSDEAGQVVGQTLCRIEDMPWSNGRCQRNSPSRLDLYLLDPQGNGGRSQFCATPVDVYSSHM
jgi:hypothetical protein